jgi:hypothetical protein
MLTGMHLFVPAIWVSASTMSMFTVFAHAGMHTVGSCDKFRKVKDAFQNVGTSQAKGTHSK